MVERRKVEAEKDAVRGMCGVCGEAQANLATRSEVYASELRSAQAMVD